MKSLNYRRQIETSKSVGVAVTISEFNKKKINISCSSHDITAVNVPCSSRLAQWIVSDDVAENHIFSRYWYFYRYSNRRYYHWKYPDRQRRRHMRKIIQEKKQRFHIFILSRLGDWLTCEFKVLQFYFTHPHNDVMFNQRCDLWSNEFLSMFKVMKNCRYYLLLRRIFSTSNIWSF